MSLTLSAVCVFLCVFSLSLQVCERFVWWWFVSLLTKLSFLLHTHTQLLSTGSSSGASGSGSGRTQSGVVFQCCLRVCERVCGSNDWFNGLARKRASTTGDRDKFSFLK